VDIACPPPLVVGHGGHARDFEVGPLQKRRQRAAAMGFSRDALTGKSKLLDYPGDYQKGEPPLASGELLKILLKNRGRLGVSLSDTALADRVRREYEQSLERILPLKEQLAQTDRLIDAVVYRLYGLTEEEIVVVEGR